MVERMMVRKVVMMVVWLVMRMEVRVMVWVVARMVVSMLVLYLLLIIPSSVRLVPERRINIKQHDKSIIVTDREKKCQRIYTDSDSDLEASNMWVIQTSSFYIN